MIEKELVPDRETDVLELLTEPKKLNKIGKQTPFDTQCTQVDLSVGTISTNTENGERVT